MKLIRRIPRSIDLGSVAMSAAATLSGALSHGLSGVVVGVVALGLGPWGGNVDLFRQGKTAAAEEPASDEEKKRLPVNAPGAKRRPGILEEETHID